MEYKEYIDKLLLHLICFSIDWPITIPYYNILKNEGQYFDIFNKINDFFTNTYFV